MHVQSYCFTNLNPLPFCRCCCLSSLLSLLYKTRVATLYPAKKNLELHLGCHTCWLSFSFTYIGMLVVGTNERADGRTDECPRDYKSLPRFLGCIDKEIFLSMVFRWTRIKRARAPLSLNIIYWEWTRQDLSLKQNLKKDKKKDKKEKEKRGRHWNFNHDVVKLVKRLTFRREGFMSNSRGITRNLTGKKSKKYQLTRLFLKHNHCNEL